MLYITFDKFNIYTTDTNCMSWMEESVFVLFCRRKTTDKESMIFEINIEAQFDSRNKLY